MTLKRLVLFGIAILVSGGCAPDRLVAPSEPTARTLRIRGPHGAQPQPMWVIDGRLYSMETLHPGLDPSQIAQIQVVKGGGAVQMYGPAGANGVIVVTTKGAAANPSRAVLDPAGILHLTGDTDFSDQALLLVDGAVVPLRRLGQLNPAEVAEIQILGGPAAVQWYGPGAADGVVLVRLKH